PPPYSCMINERAMQARTHIVTTQRPGPSSPLCKAVEAPLGLEIISYVISLVSERRCARCNSQRQPRLGRAATGAFEGRRPAAERRHSQICGAGAADAPGRDARERACGGTAA